MIRDERAIERGIWVSFQEGEDCFVPRDSRGLDFISEVNRRKRQDTVVIAKKNGRDVLDVRSKRPWYPIEGELLEQNRRIGRSV